MKIKPLGEKILLKVDTAETKTESGLFIPQTAQEKTQRGVVVEVSESVRDSLEVLPGNKVMYDKYAGTPVKIEDIDHLIIDIDDLIAVIV